MNYNKWQNKIDEVMDGFDFSNVHKTMKLLDWKWANMSLSGYETDACVPSECEIRRRARRLIIDAIKDYEATNEYAYVATGGFEVNIERECISLKFVVERYETF